MKKECSENEVRNKAEAYCSSVERCVSEVEAKLEQWGADNGIKERVYRPTALLCSFCAR